MQLDEYQQDAATTAVYPRVYTEDQVRSMLRELGDECECVDPNRVVASAGRLLDKYETAFSRLVYPVLGLIGEAGELGNKLKKWARDSAGQSTGEQEDALADELGDTLWYEAAVATGLHTNLSAIAEDNLAKLFSRKKRGVLWGSGDQR